MHYSIAVFTLLLAVSSTNAQPRKVEPAKYGWLTDYSAAKTEAKRTGKPVFLVFRCEP